MSGNATNRYCSDKPLSLDRVRVGTRLPTLTKCPSQVEVVLFCAAIRNFHRLHYDQAFTEEQGFDSVIVPGFLMGNWCLEAATRAFGPEAEVCRIKFKNTAVAPVDVAYTIEGSVTSTGKQDDGRSLVTCGFTVTGPNADVVTLGTVDIRLA